MRLLVRICAIASFAAGLSSSSYARAERLDVVERMVVADVLKRISNALDQIFLFDDGHG